MFARERDTIERGNHLLDESQRDAGDIAGLLSVEPAI